MSLEKFDQIISDYENKTRRMLEGLASRPERSFTAWGRRGPRYLFADTVFKEVYRPTLREMNELREEFMKCYYSPEPGSGYLDAKDSFERLNLENTPSLEKFDQIISDYKNKTRRFFGMVEHWDSPRTLFFDDVFNGVYRFALREMNELRQEFMKCHYSPNPGSGYLEAKDSFERLNLENQSGGKRRLKYHYNGGSPENTPSLENFDQIIFDYKNKTGMNGADYEGVSLRNVATDARRRSPFRQLFAEHALKIHRSEVRFALRNMNMLRQEFMKCHYSPNPGSGYLEAKDSFERLNLENQSGGKRRLKYHYNGGSPENDLFKVIRYIHEEKSFRPEQVNQKLLVALLSPALNIETRNKDGYTPLSLAVRELDVNMVKMLLRLGANPNSTYRGGSRYLVHYLANDDRVLENNNLEDSSDEEQKSLLSKQLEIMKLLLVNGANVNEIQTSYDYTPLHYAVKHSNYDLVELLLKHGANMELKAPFNRDVGEPVDPGDLSFTPIEWAEQYKQWLEEEIEASAGPRRIARQQRRVVSKTLKILEKHEAKRETKKLLTDQLGRTLLLNKDDPNNNRDPDDTRPHLSGHKNKVINTIKSYYGGKGKKKTRKLLKLKKLKSKKLKSKKTIKQASPVKKELPIHCIGYTKNKECIPTGLVLPFF